MSWADEKAKARRAVHNQFCIPGEYEDSSLLEPVTLCVRYHTRLDRSGLGAGEGGYAAVLEGITRLVFDKEELARKGVTLQRTGTVRLTDYDMTVTLEMVDPNDGPINETWSVTVDI